MDTPTTFGQRLRQLRERATMTQAELAERAGLSQPHVARFETGAREPSLATLYALADALGVSLDSFRDSGAEKKRRKSRNSS